jgi:hypothetical protein
MFAIKKFVSLIKPIRQEPNSLNARIIKNWWDIENARKGDSVEALSQAFEKQEEIAEEIQILKEQRAIKSARSAVLSIVETKS